MSKPQVAIALVGDTSNEEKIKDIVRNAGFEVLPHKWRQIDATRKTLEEIETNPAAFSRYFASQLNAAAEDEPTHVYLDYEHPLHLGYSKIEPLEYAEFSAQLTEIIRMNMPTGCKVGIWNPFIMIQGILATTPSSLQTLEQRQAVNPQDLLIVNGYVREHVTFKNVVRWQHRLSTGVAIAQDHARRHEIKEVYLAWQTRLRPSTGPEDFKSADTTAWWAKAGELKIPTLWWLNAGKNGEQLDARLAEFERMAPAAVAAWNSEQ